MVIKPLRKSCLVSNDLLLVFYCTSAHTCTCISTHHIWAALQAQKLSANRWCCYRPFLYDLLWETSTSLSRNTHCSSGLWYTCFQNSRAQLQMITIKGFKMKDIVAKQETNDQAELCNIIILKKGLLMNYRSIFVLSHVSKNILKCY